MITKGCTPLWGVKVFVIMDIGRSGVHSSAGNAVVVLVDEDPGRSYVVGGSVAKIELGKRSAAARIYIE